MDLFQLDIQKIRNFFLFIQLLAKLSTLSFVQQAQNAGLVEPIVLILDQLQISLAVGFQRQMMVLHFRQELLDLSLILINQVFYLNPQVPIKLFYPCKIWVNGRVFWLPGFFELGFDFTDQPDVSFGVLMRSLIALLTQKQILFTFLSKAKMCDFLLLVLGTVVNCEHIKNRTQINIITRFKLTIQHIIYVSMNLLSSNMEDVADIFIRPSRHLYKLIDMGPKNTIIEGQAISRIDFETKNKRGLTLKGSYYFKQKEDKCSNFLIYLHCNSGCRIEGLSYLKLALEHDFNYVVFDFSGSGLSQGRYISLGSNLGLHQVQDLDAVIKYIKTNVDEDAKFCLWGRSMGAVTALRYIALNKETIRVAIFDSPFSSLKKLFLEIGKQKTNFPEILLSVLYNYIKPIISQKANFNLDEIDLQQIVQEITIPGIFIASKQDSLIPFQQIDDVFNRYTGEKEMYFIEQSHNEARNMGVIKKVFKTLTKYYLLYKQQQLKKNKTSFYTIFPHKDTSKKKLQLTINSHSQRILKFKEPLESRPHHINIDFQDSAKKQSSFLLMAKNKRTKITSEINLSINHSESFIEKKRKPLIPRHTGSQDNLLKEEFQGRPKFAGETRVIEIQMRPIKQKDGRSRERKTFQHISSKRPPFVELKGSKEFRSSLQLRYRS